MASLIECSRYVVFVLLKSTRHQEPTVKMATTLLHPRYYNTPLPLLSNDTVSPFLIQYNTCVKEGLINFPLTCLVQEPEYFSGRQANIHYRGSCIGSFGIVSPEVSETSPLMNCLYGMLP